MIKTISPNRMYVVEVGADAYLGRISVVNSVVFIYSGFTGRPPMLALEDIDEITLVEHHPDVVIVEYDNEMLDDMDERISTLEESLDSMNVALEKQDEEIFSLLS